MKFHLPYLKTGDALDAEVIEIQASGELVLSVDGDLLRVRNITGHTVAVGEHLQLRVVAVDPLRFQLLRGRTLGTYESVV